MSGMGGGVIRLDRDPDAIKKYQAEYHKQIAAAREKLPDLQNEHKQVMDRIKANDARLREIGQRLNQIPLALVEADDPDRKQAIMQERRDLLEEQEMIGLERVGLRQMESKLNFALNEARITAH